MSDMNQTTINQNEFVVSVGPLNSLSSLMYHLAEPLTSLNREFVSGKNPDVIWDLRNVMPGQQNMASLTAFLSLAHRLRLFTGRAQEVLLEWKPKVLSFWSDIGFLDLSRKYDLIKWPEQLIGGFPSNVTNPNTIIIDYPSETNIPDQADNEEEWKKWKDETREEVKAQLMLKCSRLFEKSRNFKLPTRLRDQITITSSELVLNSILHGKSMAFLGMQRTSKRISVSVCDAGIGFVNSLQKQSRDWSKIKDMKNIEAILIGSIENTREMGLRRSIDMTVQVGGYVEIFSNDAEMRWRTELWEKAKNSLPPERYVVPDMQLILGDPVHGTATAEQKRMGYYRTWQQALRGTRISFDIDFSNFED
jgi:hypothetical protein